LRSRPGGDLDYGDDRGLDATDPLVRTRREWLAKLSYALQS